MSDLPLGPIKYEVNTDVFESGLIEQSISYGGVEPIARFIMDTRDDQVRRALIKLGWTPPQDDSLTTDRGGSNG